MAGEGNAAVLGHGLTGVRFAAILQNAVQRHPLTDLNRPVKLHNSGHLWHD